jgi:uncharacterized protein (TIGR03435 family)
MSHMRRVVVALLSIGVTVVVAAQTTPAFEVASIRPSDALARGGRSGWQPGGRYEAINVPGGMLVQIAYGTAQRTLLGYQLIGAPSWLMNARYDIVGKVRRDLADTDISTLAPKGPQYLLSLLQERFKLQAHHETRELPRYRLVRVGAFGPRLRRTTCQADDICKLEYGPSRYRFEGITLARFAADLSGNLSQVIVDGTELSGRFDLELEWSLDQAATDDKPSIFTAIQEQLGLRLQPERGPVDVVVIDHIERPSEN